MSIPPVLDHRVSVGLHASQVVEIITPTGCRSAEQYGENQGNGGGCPNGLHASQDPEGRNGVSGTGDTGRPVLLRVLM
jgi:hypothetical protein